MKTRMKRRTKLAGVLFTAVLTMSVALALADQDGDQDTDQDTVTGRLSGFQETPLTISSPGSAEFIILMLNLIRSPVGRPRQWRQYGPESMS